MLLILILIFLRSCLISGLVHIGCYDMRLFEDRFVANSFDACVVTCRNFRSVAFRKNSLVSVRSRAFDGRLLDSRHLLRQRVGLIHAVCVRSLQRASGQKWLQGGKNQASKQINGEFFSLNLYNVSK
ncbi:uncharacterized protein LOC127852446 [Dreissena polymorpha]|uniref:uncharacterized protein LOC127852446 n=1 Tax=Dreissena polymorpha TaxID=45954 RepID=UPI0022655C4B|nr:uncharacterized protein LOC127852446 [Dreissena polymorpha]